MTPVSIASASVVDNSTLVVGLPYYVNTTSIVVPLNAVPGLNAVTFRASLSHFAIRYWFSCVLLFIISSTRCITLLPVTGDVSETVIPELLPGSVTVISIVYYVYDCNSDGFVTKGDVALVAREAAWMYPPYSFLDQTSSTLCMP